MKVAFVGKGGSGKTTLAALFARTLTTDTRALTADRTRTEQSTRAEQVTRAGHVTRTGHVLAFDADINQHLAAALGATDEEALLLPAMGDHLPAIKEYLRGDNPRISSAAAMVKTTPPGRGSRLLSVAGPSPLHDLLVREVGGVRIAVTGPFATEDLGVACYHSKVGAVELFLNHLYDGPGEYAIVDMTAGADAFASGLFTRFDLTFLVCEPTVRSVGVYRQYAGYAAEYGVPIAVVGNKVDDESDVEFLREHTGTALLAWIGRSAYVKAAERGHVGPIGGLEPANAAALAAMRTALDARPKDWRRYAEQAALFHRRNATGWANDKVGEDLSAQIDHGFVLGRPGDVITA
ncbi:ATP-binding protein [Hamadaea tsunoensis]|uniref:ATP-binding protein n=1 Tax=Hamadaea tsunoensis TaxID=53368 RepID=UPI00040AC24B|nr:ATP-binding protein [Hamadaea tsunoensis]